jgi:hypothetical protein
MPLLIEAVECVKPPKGPPSAPTVKTWSVVELKRAVSSIVGRRNRLEKALTKLTKSQDKVVKSPTNKTQQDLACAELGVKAAKNWLEFTTSRYNLLKSKVEEHATGETKAKLDAVLAWGEPIAADGAAHNAATADDGTQGDVPSIPDIKYDFKSNKLVDGAGNEISIDTEPAAPAPAPAPPPAPLPPPPEPPKKTELSTADKVSLGAKVKATFLQGVKDGKSPNLGAAMAAHGVGLIKDVGLEATVFSGKNVSDLTIAQAVDLGKKALELVKADPGKLISNIKALRAFSVEVLGDGHLNLQASKEILNKAKEEFDKLPKPFEKLLPSQQHDAKAVAKKVVIAGGWGGAGFHEMVGNLAAELASSGLHLTPTAVASLVGSATGSYVNQGLGTLPKSTQDLILNLATAAVAGGSSIPEALAAANMPHLSPASVKNLNDMVKAEPDEGGFLDEIKKHLDNLDKDHPLPSDFGGIVITIDEESGTKFVGLMSTFHIEKVKDTPLEIKVKLQAELVIESRWNYSALEKMVFDHFNKKVSEGDYINAAVYAHSAMIDVLDTDAAIKVGGYTAAIKVTQHGQGIHDFMTKLFNKWHAAHEANKPKPKDVKAALEGFSAEIVNMAGWNVNDVPEHIEQLAQDFAAAHDVSLSEVLAGLFIADTQKATATPPAPPPAPSSVSHLYTPTTTDLAHTSEEKLSDFYDLTHGQRKWVTGQVKQAMLGGAIPLLPNGAVDLSSKSYKAWRTGIRKSMKALWGPSGVTSVGYKMFDERAAWVAEHQSPIAAPAPAPVVPPAPAAPAGIDPESLAHDTPAAKKKLLAAYGGLVSDHAGEMDAWQQVNVPEIALKLGGGGGSDKQWSMVKKATAKMATAAMSAPPIMGAGFAPDPQPATMPETVAETLPSTNPLGMSPAQIKAHLANHGKPSMAPGVPNMGGGAWVGKEAIFGHGGGGVHSKSLAPCGADGIPDKNGDHLWMVKTAGTPATRYLAYAENFAIRLQSLVGLGNTKESWVEDNGLGGEKSLVQLFEDQPHLEGGEKGNGLAAKTPWIVSPTVPNAAELAKQFARYHILHFVIDDKDDHAGNFVQDEKTGELTSVDHGQSFKFFDPKRTMITDFDYQPQSAGNTGSLPRKMLKHWAQGKDVALDNVLGDPALLDTLDRLESIPSDVYMDSLRPYAEKQIEHFGKIGKTSSLKKFLSAANARRTKIRAEVGGFYAHMAEERAKALKGKGDPRPLDQITQSVKDSIGLDAFMGGGKPKPSPVAAPVIPLADDPPTWQDKKLPESSRVPSAVELKKAGSIGVDVVMSSDHVKNGMATFTQIGENPIMWCRLEPDARAILSSRLPGASGGPQPPPAPASFAFNSFTPPAAPTFSSSGEELNDEFINSGGVGSWVDPVTGNPAPRVVKYIGKWSKGISKGDPGLQYVRQAWDWAKEKSVSADPVEAAIGTHYVNALSKMGSIDGAVWAFKPHDTVADEDKKITTFAVTPDLLALRDVVKANAVTEHEKATATAKTVWQADHDEAKKAWDKKEVAYKKKYAEYEKTIAATNTIPAKKLTDWPAPDGVTHNSVSPSNPNVAGKSGQPKGKGKALDNGTAWAGGFINQSSKPGTSGQPESKTAYEIDMTDAVSHIKTKGGAPTDRLLIHFQPAPANKTGRQPGRDGAFRVQFPAGSSPAQMKKMMQAVNAHLGLDVRPSSHKEQELSYLRQMAWHRHMEGYGTAGRAQVQETKALGADATTQQKIDYWAKRFEEAPSNSVLSGRTGNGVGYDPRYAVKLTPSGKPSKTDGKVVYKKKPDGTRKKNPAYHPVAVDIGAGVKQFRRFDVTDKEINSSQAKTLAASVGSGTIESLLLSMTLSCTNHRANVGFNGLGWSSAADTKTGGSNTTYLRTTSSPNNDHSLQFSPLMHSYTGCWSHPSDEYGATQSYIGGNSHSQRSATVKEMREALSRSVGSGETLGWHRVDMMKWVQKIDLTKASIHNKPDRVALRDKVRKAIAKAQGVPESEARMGIDNKLVDEVIIV